MSAEMDNKSEDPISQDSLDSICGRLRPIDKDEAIKAIKVGMLKIPRLRDGIIFNLTMGCVFKKMDQGEGISLFEAALMNSYQIAQKSVYGERVAKGKGDLGPNGGRIITLRPKDVKDIHLKTIILTENFIFFLALTHNILKVN